MLGKAPREVMELQNEPNMAEIAQLGRGGIDDRTGAPSVNGVHHRHAISTDRQLTEAIDRPCEDQRKPR
jgi:hypothetical protein